MVPVDLVMFYFLGVAVGFFLGKYYKQIIKDEDK